MKDLESALRAYGKKTVRVLVGLLAVPVMLLVWWTGQGCVDDPCNISRGAEIRGLVFLIVVGAVVLALVSKHHRALRVLGFLTPAIPILVRRWNDPPQPEGQPIVSEAPGVALVGPALLASFVALIVVTLLIEWAALWKLRDEERQLAAP